MSHKLKEIIELSAEEQARNQLIQKQVLLPFDERTQVFHGRVNMSGDKFFVKSGFDNSGKTFGHNNNNSIPGLHASEFGVAKKYAEKRFIESAIKTSKAGKIEIHKIEPLESNLFILDITKLFEEEDIMPYLENVFHIPTNQIQDVQKNILPQEEKQEVCENIKVLASKHLPQTLMPKLFEGNQNQKILKDCLEICRQNEKQKKPYVLDDDLEKYVLKNSKDEKTEEQIRNIAGAVNVFQILRETGDIKFLMSKFQSNFDFCENMSLNLKMFRAFLRQQGIVGVKQKLWISDVIQDKNIDDYFFFDTKRVGTGKTAQKIKNDARRQQTTQKPFGA